MNIYISNRRLLRGRFLKNSVHFLWWHYNAMGRNIGSRKNAKGKEEWVATVQIPVDKRERVGWATCGCGGACSCVVFVRFLLL